MTKHGQTIDRAFLFSLLQKPNTVLLESSRQDEANNKNLLFHSPLEILTANDLDEIPGIFEKIEEHLKQRRWIAGYIGYECGYHFEKVVGSFKNRSEMPLLWLGVLNPPLSVDNQLLNDIDSNSSTKTAAPVLSTNLSAYRKNIEKIKEHIVNGDTYQVNFTDRFTFDCDGDARELYFELRKKQHVPFGAFISTEKANILSFSPELFFRRSGNAITTKPMKGTCKRGKNLEEDALLSEWLKNDEKNKSENLMIVDLLRNDLGRICESGAIDVRDMYSIEKYETVLQMTSTIDGTLKKGVGYYEIFRSLFPCGSVTGAPKIKTMQIIEQLEQHQRGVYCGAIGFISPDDEAVFNVAIRTIELRNNKGTMGVGSGIVFDSDPEKEFEECRLKAAFLLNERIDFHLLETILWNGNYTFLSEHLDRIKSSAEYFSIPFDLRKISESLSICERSLDRSKEYRIRLLLSQNGAPFTEASEIVRIENSSVIKIARERTDTKDKFLFHKTTRRELYVHYWKKATDEGISEYIFLNENDEITEGSISNIFIEKNGKLFTPPISCGLLPGIYRSEVLKTNPNSSEKIIKIDDLRSADALYICNSVRGWNKVTLSEE